LQAICLPSTALNPFLFFQLNIKLSVHPHILPTASTVRSDGPSVGLLPGQEGPQGFLRNMLHVYSLAFRVAFLPFLFSWLVSSTGNESEACRSIHLKSVSQGGETCAAFFLPRVGKWCLNGGQVGQGPWT